MSARGVTLEQVMEDTSDALDVGLLRFSSGATIGTGGFIDTPNQRLLVNHELPIVTPGDLAKVAVKGSGPNAVRLGDVADLTIGTQAAVRRRRRQRRPRAADDRREVSVGQHAPGHARCGQGGQGASARPSRRHDRHPHLPRLEFHQRLDRQSHAGAADRRAARHPGALRVPVRVADGPDQHDRDPALADRRRPRALLARRHDQRDGARGPRDRARRGRRRRDHRHREHLAAPAAAPRGGRQHRRSRRSSSRHRSRCGARSSTRR